MVVASSQLMRKGRSMAYLEDLTLFYSPTCPYCHKVLAYMQKQDIACQMKNTMEPGVRDELIQIGGKGQVPCLIISGQPMYESNDIIDYLHGLMASEERG